MWCPCAIACAISLFASNTLLTSVGLVMTISNIAGVFFVRDLLTELSTEAQALTVSKSQSHSNRKGLQICRLMICIGLCLQIGFYGFAMQFKQLPTKDPFKATEGPFSGMLMNEQQYNAYKTSLRDLDLIKSKAEKTEPVLIVSYQNWMYLYVDQPIATYTTWFYGGIRADNLRDYYSIKPEKIPKYIYVVYKDKEDFAAINIDNVKENMEELRELFDFTEEPLSDGVLMTVSDYKSEQIN